MNKRSQSSQSKLNSGLKNRASSNQSSKKTLGTDSKRGDSRLKKGEVSKLPSTQDSHIEGGSSKEEIDVSQNPFMIEIEEAMQATLDANGEFVKTNLIRDVVYDMLIEFKKHMSKFEKDMKNQGHVIRDHTNRLKTIDTDIKGINQKLGEIGELRSQIGMINKTVGKIDKNQRMQIDEKELQQSKMEAKLKMISDVRNELNLFRKEKSQIERTHMRLIDNNYDDLSVQIAKVDEKYAFQQKETGNKLRNFTNKLTTIENSYKETKQHIQTTLVNLVNDMERYHTQEREANDKTERSLKALLSLKEKFKNYSAIIDQCKARIECTDQVQLFVERSLPVLIHLQICESLKQIITHDRFDKLHKFENAKIDELYAFVHLNKGFRPEIGILNDRIQALTEHYYKEKKGVAEFKWGVDYEPSMVPEKASLIDQKIFENRDKLALYVEKDKNYLEQVKKYIEDSYSMEEKQIEIAKHHLKTLLPQIKDYQLPQLHSWILRKKMLNDDFDSIVLAFKSGEEDDELVDFYPGDMMGMGVGGGDNTMMSPNSEDQQLQLPDSKGKSVKSKIKSSQATNAPSAPAQPAKKMTKKEFQMHQMMQMMQQANEIRRMYEEGPKHNVYVWKSQKMHLQCTKDDRKFKMREKKGRRVIRDLFRKVTAIENAMPEEFKKIHELESQGQTVDFRKLVEEQEAKESEDAIRQILENATRVSKLDSDEYNIQNLGPSEQTSVKSEVFVKNKQDPEYRKSVLESAKRKVKRAMLKVKMTMTIAKEKQVRLKQLKDSRPQYAIDLENFKQQQVQEIQKIVDDSIDWVMMYIKQNLEVKVEQINERLTNKTNDIEEYSLRNVGTLKSQQEANFSKVNLVYEQCQVFEKQMQDINEAFKRDNKALIKFKQRLCSDIEVANKKIMNDLNMILQKMQGFAVQSNKNRHLINSILQSSMIDQLILEQDSEDRKALNLLGQETNQNILGSNQGALNNYKVPGRIQKTQVQGEGSKNDDESKTQMDTAKKSFGDRIQKDTHNPIKVNSDYLLQEGSFHANNLLKQIKLACISYQASPIEYRNIKLSQKELLETREKLLMSCQQMMQSMSPVDTTKVTISTIIGPKQVINSQNSPKIDSQEMSMEELQMIPTPKEVQVKNSTKDLYEDVTVDKKMESKDLNRTYDTMTTQKSAEKGESYKILSKKKEIKRAQSNLASRKWSNKFKIDSLIQKTSEIQQENEKIQASFGKSLDLSKLFSGAKNLETTKTENKNFKKLNINHIQRKNVHLALKSNAYHQLTEMATQDMMQQFVDSDLKQVQKEIQQTQPVVQNPLIIPPQTFNDLVSIGKFKQNDSKQTQAQLDQSKHRIETIQTEKNITFSDGNFFDSPTRGYSGINSGADLKSVYKTVIPSSHMDKNPNVTTGSLRAFHPEINQADYEQQMSSSLKSKERSQSSFGNRQNMKLRISKRSKTPSQNTNTRNKVIGFTTYNNLKKQVTGKPDPQGIPSVLGSQAIIQTVASSGSNAVIFHQRQRNQQMNKLKQIDENRRSKSTVKGGKNTDENSQFTGRSLQEGSVFTTMNVQDGRQFQSVADRKNIPPQESMVGHYQHRKASIDFDQVKYKNETLRSQPEIKNKIQTQASPSRANNSHQNSNYHNSVIEKPSNPREIQIKTKKMKGTEVSNSYGEPHSDQVSLAQAMQTQSSHQKIQQPAQVFDTKQSFAAKKLPQQVNIEANKEPQNIKDKLKLDLNLQPETRRLVPVSIPKPNQQDQQQESSLEEESKVELIITNHSVKGGILSPIKTLEQIETKNNSIKSDINDLGGENAKKELVDELMNVIEPKLTIKDNNQNQ